MAPLPLYGFVSDFYNDPSFDNFNVLVQNVNETNCRGAINKEGIDTCAFDVIGIACIAANIKPIAWLNYSEEFEKWQHIWSRMNHIIFQKNNKTNLIVYQDGQKEKAEKLADYLSNPNNIETLFWEQDGKSYIQNNYKYHQFVGELLGYPQSDIDYFNYRKN